LRIGDEFGYEARYREREKSGEHEKYVPPAHEVAEDAAGGLAK
jgi:hypothetical protein